MNDTKRLRRPPAGGYARGDETRRRIIEAAVSLFGQHGFESTSTRDIAARAGVNAPALQYYFENKEGLYRACVESFADEFWQTFEPIVAKTRAALARDAEVEELITLFTEIQRAMVDRVLMKHGKTDQQLFFVREQGGAEPEIGTRILRERLRAPLNELVATLVGRITGLRADDPLNVMHMFSLLGQIMMFHHGRESALSLLGWKDFDGERAEFLKTGICTQSRTLLEHWHREGKKKRK
jgi:TetR/AcrR family transcriptional regulator, regulator of cefoperazone and chloramphenicol sensitivity